MMKHLPLIICAISAAPVSADDLSDFSNNLATDVGPLLVLFGESMTRQYLSESTSFLDYFIFAMAPIGIITAIVSAIRVCGHSTLRAFIGRSQEGDGIVEAELCTSTSRDVCELFNKGGITRVLGRPCILELIHTPGKEEEVYLFRDYLENHKDSDISEWTVMRSTAFRSGNKPNNSPSHLSAFAPKPNLSLNVGIKKRPRWVFISVAALGFLLQAGVVALAGAGVWMLQWNLSESGSPASTNYAPIMFIIGTIAMCGGMWSCAALIGQTTQEVRYSRGDGTPRSRLLWLQPGPQVIGDQSFDPFVHFENTDKEALRVWTSSSKNLDERFELYTFFAVSAVLLGYIAQFIGLRGMKAWVSLAQLGITVVMSILRGLLRVQRLGRDGNRLLKMPDLIVGHEIDWLSFELALGKSQDRALWCITGQHKEAKVQRASSTQMSNPQHSSRLSGEEHSSSNATDPGRAESMDACNDQNNYDKILHIRERLSYLTGHGPINSVNTKDYQQWQNHQVKVRQSAQRLSIAIRQVAERLFHNDAIENEITVQVEVAACPGGSTKTSKQLIDITLTPLHQATQTIWSVNSAQLEAILGLSMWTLVSSKHLQIEDEAGNQTSLAESVTSMRIVSACVGEQKQYDKSGKQLSLMELWLGSNSLRFANTYINISQDDMNGIVDLWCDANTQNVWTKLSPEPDGSQANPSTLIGHWGRFCGWNVVFESLRSQVADLPNIVNPKNRNSTPSDMLRIEVVPTEEPLVAICAQDLFMTILTSLSDMLVTDTTGIGERRGNVRLENSTITTLTNVLVESGLASHFNALLCVVPVLNARLHPGPEPLFSALVEAANTYRRNSEWGRAEILMRWACHYYHSPDNDNGTSTHIPPLFVRALRATGELYRWSLAQQSIEERWEFGSRGIDWMSNSYSSDVHRDTEIDDILRCYQSIARKLDNCLGAVIQDTNESRRYRDEHPLVKAIEHGDRGEALYQLCFTTTGNFDYKALLPALPLAAKNNWVEVVDAILEMKGSPESQDRKGRTAVFHCAAHGYVSLLQRFIDQGALLDQEDSFGQTPFMQAIRCNQTEAVEKILKAGRIACNKEVDHTTPLEWSVRKGLVDIAQLLLEKGAGLDARGRNEPHRIMLLATKSGNKAMVEMLLRRNMSLESKNYNLQTLLAIVAGRGDEAAVSLLLEVGADVGSVDKFGRTPLLLAIENGRRAATEALLEYSDSPTTQRRVWGSLLLAMAKGHETCVQRLLEKCAAIKSGSTGVEIPTPLATESQYEVIRKLLLETVHIQKAEIHPRQLSSSDAMKSLEDVIRLLLEKGADIDVENENGTALTNAIIMGNEAIARLLLDNGANLQWKGRADWTPLFFAAVRGREAIVRLLLEKDADLESKDTYNETPLLHAARREHEATVRLLLDNGANMESKDRHGQTPLSSAARCGHEAIVRLLLDNGANVESKDRHGQTPLSSAARCGHEAIVRLLLEKDADSESKDDENETPLSHAVKRNHQAIVSLLREKVANRGHEVASRNIDQLAD